MRRFSRLFVVDEDDNRDWRRQNVSDRPLYDYINLRCGGRLVEVFDKSSSREQCPKALDCIIRREIVRFLYNGGAGKVQRSRRNAFAPQTSGSTQDLHTENQVRAPLFGSFYTLFIPRDAMQSLGFCPSVRLSVKLKLLYPDD